MTLARAWKPFSSVPEPADLTPPIVGIIRWGLDFCFLGVHITEDLPLGVNTAELAKKAEQRLFFLWVLRKNIITQKLLVSFY